MSSDISERFYFQMFNDIQVNLQDQRVSEVQTNNNLRT